MIPINVEDFALKAYKKNVFSFFNKMKNGKKKLLEIDNILSLINTNLTFEKLLFLEFNELEKLKIDYDQYIKKIPKPKKMQNKKGGYSYPGRNKYNLKTLRTFVGYYEKILAKEKGVEFIQNLNIEVCPYCNRNYIYNTIDLRTAQIDHFISKDEYPIFALSFFNLVPSCQTCNYIKLNNNIPYLLNPYDKTRLTDRTFIFKIKIPSVGKYEINLSVNDKVNQKYADELNTKLKLGELYKHHSYLAKELYEKSEIYTKDFVDSIKSTFFNNSSISISESEFKRLILSNYGEETDFYKRTLSKATRDIAEQLNLLEKL